MRADHSEQVYYLELWPLKYLDIAFKKSLRSNLSNSPHIIDRPNLLGIDTYKQRLLRCINNKDCENAADDFCKFLRDFGVTEINSQEMLIENLRAWLNNQSRQ